MAMTLLCLQLLFFANLAAILLASWLVDEIFYAWVPRSWTTFIGVLTSVQLARFFIHTAKACESSMVKSSEKYPHMVNVCVVFRVVR